MYMKKFIIISLVLASIVVLIYFLFARSVPNLKEKWEIREVRNSAFHESVFLKRSTRGLNYSCIVLSSDDSSRYDKTKEFRYNADKVFFKFDADTLVIVSGSISTNPSDGFPAKFKVKCIQIKDNIGYISFINEYKKNGFEMFP